MAGGRRSKQSLLDIVELPEVGQLSLADNIPADYGEYIH